MGAALGFRYFGMCEIVIPMFALLFWSSPPSVLWSLKRFGREPTGCSLGLNRLRFCANASMRCVIEAMQNGARPIKSANGTRLLTRREEELVQLVAEGLTNRDISRQLSLREHTVRNYLFRVFNKLGTSNRLELALYVLKQRGE